MSIWEYNDKSTFLNREIITKPHCVFCDSPMDALPVAHVELEHREEATQVYTCAVCGWWKLIRVDQQMSPRRELTPDSIWDQDGYGSRFSTERAAIGSLKELDLKDVRIPIDEIKQYLVIKYEERFALHPRLFEETVASVFKDLGYYARVTAYSGDGGIDVVLDSPDGSVIGVQVKRYRNTIKVEQIRSLAGALLLGGYTRGIFVATSSFQSGAKNTADMAAARGLPIELLDANRFLDAMKIGRRNAYKSTHDRFAPFYNLSFEDLKWLG